MPTSDLPSLYLSGPMSDQPYFNFPTFDSAAATLRYRGYPVTSPAELDDPATRAAALKNPTGKMLASANGESYGAFLARDIKIVLDVVDAVALLPGWEDSPGACIEAFAAQRVGKDLYTFIPALGCLKPYTGKFAVIEEEPLIHVNPDLRESDLSGPTHQMTEDGHIIQLEQGGEVRVTDPNTGGQKGSKMERFDLIPTEPLRQLAEHYGRGSLKYEDRNWERGYAWSLSYAALCRHLFAWWGGEDDDPETGSNHLVAVAWHAFALLEYQRTHPEQDDRPWARLRQAIRRRRS